jgi:DNA topoisomerase VI subunit B
MAARREQFVTTKEFLDSARSLGIKSLEGICELVDNAFDADATNIRIHIENNNDGTLQIIFVDDGLGIPAIHIDEDKNKRQGIPYILAYGGRIPHPNRPEPIGKFGWGLSQTASCLSRRTEVYSRTEDDDGWRSCWYDFEELLADDCELPLE